MKEDNIKTLHITEKYFNYGIFYKLEKIANTFWNNIDTKLNSYIQNANAKTYQEQICP